MCEIKVKDVIVHAGEFPLLVPQYKNSFLYYKLRTIKKLKNYSTLISSHWTNIKKTKCRLFRKNSSKDDIASTISCIMLKNGQTYF